MDELGQQHDTVAFLMHPHSYPDSPERIERLDTHGAMVFLAGERAYKLKRAVKLPYLDFSTLEKRRAVCERELRINRRTAPGLYLDVLPIRRGAGGALQFGGEGEDVDWVVVMKRFPQEALFDRLCTSGQLDMAMMPPLADAIRRFHGEAERADGARWLPALRRIAETLEETLLGGDAAPLALPAGRYLDALRAELDRREPLLLRRQRDGHVRRCHGDLHLKNIVLDEGQPVLFDALEFDDDLSSIDVLYDLAFLLMDLIHRDRLAEANAVLNRYVEGEADSAALDGLALLPLFLSLRAAIRAMVGVHGLPFAGPEGRAGAEQAIRDYLALATAALNPPPPMLVCVGGLSGSGKTTVARGLAPRIGALPGALHLRSDVERKRMFSAEPTARLDSAAYTEDVGRQVHRRVLERAASVLRAGHSVIVDAVFRDAARRDPAEQAARDAGAAFAGLWLEADPGRMVARVEQRRNDASDATAEIVLQQVRAGITPPAGWARIDANGGVEETLARARHAPGLRG
jgi:aminoglycoside phosphotransferase family enzyme/predicted kinase